MLANSLFSFEARVRIDYIEMLDREVRVVAHIIGRTSLCPPADAVQVAFIVDTLGQSETCRSLQRMSRFNSVCADSFALTQTVHAIPSMKTRRSSSTRIRDVQDD